MISNDEFLSIAAEIATEVGEQVNDRRSAGFEWSTKSTSADVVTEIDTWAEEEIVRRTTAARPNDGLLGEEGASSQGTTGVVWVIDPIDGTTNLLYDLPGYGVSIAAQVEGRTVAGAVYDPVRLELFAAASGGGATRNGTPLYDIAETRILHHMVTETPVRLSSLRGLGAMPNVFAMECAIDEYFRQLVK